jgi:hypothetical protein
MPTSSTAYLPGVHSSRACPAGGCPISCGQTSARIEYAGPVAGFLNWWDGVELWLTGLPFVVQTAVVMPVVLALAYGVAVVLDGALGNGIRMLRRVRHDDSDVE